MSKIIHSIVFCMSIILSFSLPDDVRVGLGAAYNSNFLKFSDYEIDNLSNNLLILGDSDTYDSPKLNFSIKSIYGMKYLPLSLNLDIGLQSYTQSVRKTSYYGAIVLAHRIGDYKWIKVGYKNKPNNYLRMYKDHDQIGSSLNAADFNYERLFSSISFPILNKVWLRAQISKSSFLFNENFTEFDLIQNQIFIKIYNLKYKSYIFYPYIKIILSNNTTYQRGLLSNNIDRSYNEYVIGNDIKRKTFSKKFFDNYKAIISFKLRNYISSDLIDVLHNNRSHIEFSLLQNINKSINERVNISMYFEYVNRATDASSDYVEDLKSFNYYECGFEFIFNLTDKLYEVIY